MIDFVLLFWKLFKKSNCINKNFVKKPKPNKKVRFRFHLAEMKRFELLRPGSPDLPHFECGPFNHLGTSPYIILKSDASGLSADVEILSKISWIVNKNSEYKRPEIFGISGQKNNHPTGWLPCVVSASTYFPERSPTKYLRHEWA